MTSYLSQGGGYDRQEYVAFVDADDWVEPEFLQTLAALCGADGSRAMSACNYVWQKPTDRHFRSKNGETVVFDKLTAIEQIFIDRYLFVPLWNKLFKKKYLAGIRFDSSLFWGEDLAFLFAFLNGLPADATVGYTTKKLYHYIKTKGSLSSLGFNKRKLKVLDTFDMIKSVIKEKYTPRQLTYANAWEFLVVLEFTWYMRRLKDKDGYKRLKQRGESLKKDYYAVKKEYKLMRRMGGAAFRLI